METAAQTPATVRQLLPDMIRAEVQTVRHGNRYDASKRYTSALYRMKSAGKMLKVSFTLQCYLVCLMCFSSWCLTDTVINTRQCCDHFWPYCSTRTLTFSRGSQHLLLISSDTNFSTGHFSGSVFILMHFFFLLIVHNSLLLPELKLTLKQTTK